MTTTNHDDLIARYLGTESPTAFATRVEVDAYFTRSVVPARERAEAEASPAPVPYLLHKARMGRPPTGRAVAVRILCDQATADRYRAAAMRLDAPLSQVMRMAISALEQAEDEIKGRIETDD